MALSRAMQFLSRPATFSNIYCTRSIINNQRILASPSTIQQHCFSLCRPTMNEFGISKSDEENENTWRRRRFLRRYVVRRLLFYSAAIVACIVLYNRESKMEASVMIGGDFELTDHTGKTVTNQDYLGRWLLIYFGFVHCPTTCPEQLERIIKITDLVDDTKSESELQPIFISVDPVRDTPEKLAAYVKEFSGKLIGLTGSPEDIDSVAQKFQLDKSEDGNYDVEHSIGLYLMDPSGQFVAQYGTNSTEQETVKSIVKHMQSF